MAIIDKSRLKIVITSQGLKISNKCQKCYSVLETFSFWLFQPCIWFCPNAHNRWKHAVDDIHHFRVDQECSQWEYSHGIITLLRLIAECIWHGVNYICEVFKDDLWTYRVGIPDQRQNRLRNNIQWKFQPRKGLPWFTNNNKLRWR